MLHPIERWLPVPGYEGLYEASDEGRIRSTRRPGSKGGLKKLSPNKRGYLEVNLSRNGKKKTWLVHQLIALTFHGERLPGMEVRHLDGDSLNNHDWNLRWGTSAENKQDTVDHGTHPQARKDMCPEGHEYTEDNTYHPPSRPTGRECKRCRAAKGQLRRQVVQIRWTSDV